MTKRHRRWKADPMAFARVIALTELFNEKEVRAITLPAREAFEALVHGGVTAEGVDEIISTLNVTVVRSGGSNMMTVAGPALEAMRRCKERYERLGKWGLDGPGIADVEQGLQLHEELVRKSTPRQMRDAAMVVDKFRMEYEQDQSKQRDKQPA